MSENNQNLLESEEVLISKIKGFLYPIIAIAAIIVLAVGSYFLLIDKGQLTASKYTKYMENKGYTVSEVEGKKHNYLQAEKDGVYIQFFHEETEDSTVKYFNQSKKNIQKYYKDCETTDDKVIGKDTETFMIVSKNKSSYLFVQSDIDNFDEVDKLFDELGY